MLGSLPSPPGETSLYTPEAKILKFHSIGLIIVIITSILLKSCLCMQKDGHDDPPTAPSGNEDTPAFRALVKEDRHRKARALLSQHLASERESAAKSKQQAQLDATKDPFNPLSVDDVDGLDPETEHLEWQLRQLERVKRYKERKEARVKEREELERIRRMTSAERAAIDAQKQAEWDEQEADKAEYAFLQKYYHKGAFYQDDPILQRDYSESTGASRHNKEVLPSVLQVRDFGKKSRSKWTHLTAEDTTAFDYGWGAKDKQINYANVSKMGGCGATWKTR